jgi:hypothetical protein
VGEDLNEAWRLFLRIFDPRLMGGELTMLLDFSTQVSCFALYFSTSRDRSPSSDTGPYFILRRRVALHSTRPILFSRSLIDRRISSATASDNAEGRRRMNDRWIAMRDARVKAVRFLPLFSIILP